MVAFGIEIGLIWVVMQVRRSDSDRCTVLPCPALTDSFFEKYLLL